MRTDDFDFASHAEFGKDIGGRLHRLKIALAAHNNADDRVIQGIKVREADGLLVLRTAEAKEVTVPLKDVAERGKSLDVARQRRVNCNTSMWVPSGSVMKPARMPLVVSRGARSTAPPAASTRLNTASMSGA